MATSDEDGSGNNGKGENAGWDWEKNLEGRDFFSGIGMVFLLSLFL